MPPIPTWSRLDDGWNNWKVFGRIYVWGGVQPKSIEALNGEVAFGSFLHVSSIRWARTTRRLPRFVCQGFWCLKTKKTFLFVSFSLLWRFSTPVFSLSSFVFR
jgi:hypothetical protein